MIDRYTRAKMKSLWSEENRLKKWLEIELFVCEALHKEGLISKDILNNIKRKARFDIDKIKEIEKVSRHDVVAFVEYVANSIGEDGRYIHWGLTSSDILDTSLNILLKEASDIILEDIDLVLESLKEKAFRYKYTPMIGRTHGMHAEPITFGIKLARWFEEMKRNRKRMEEAKREISVGKISGAVGTYVYNSPFVEKYVCKRCGLKASSISSQIISRDIYAYYFTTLAVIGTSIEKFATEIRHLQRTEIAEVAEPFFTGQKGSSAMPHKRNPILSENLCGLARLLRSYAIASLENVALWHERDISHSSVERIIAPDSTTLLDFMLNRFNSIIKDLEVFPQNMQRNIEIDKDIFYSQRILLELINKGLSRQKAYELVQKNAHKAVKTGKNFKTLLSKDKQILSYLTPKQIEKICQIDYFFQHIETIFKQVFVTS